ncbi:MAG: hypothetical protein P1U56_12615 [Saprospiraceae bacterium]|nr:hypothetical protein [Saprospiraceae bacterium]
MGNQFSRFSIYIFPLLFIFSNAQSCTSQQEKKVNLQTDRRVEKPKTETSKKAYKWSLEGTRGYRANSEGKWVPSSQSSILYDSVSKSTISIGYRDYSDLDKNYSTRNETRRITNGNVDGEITSSVDVGLESWNGQKGTIFIYNEKGDVYEEYQYRYDMTSEKWQFYNLMRDSFDHQGLKVQRYFLSDIDPGNYPVQRSKVQFIYEDTLLVETMNMGQKGGLETEWELSRKEVFSYEDGALKSERLYFFDEKKNMFYLSTERIWERKKTETIDNFAEFDINEKSIHKNQTVEEFDAEGELIRLTNFNWENDSRSFVFDNEKRIRRRNGKILEEQMYYEEHEIKSTKLFTYDAQQRLIRIVEKNKINKENELKVANTIEYGYEGENTKHSFVVNTNQKGETKKKRFIEFDEFGNPTSQYAKVNSVERLIEIEYDSTILLDEVQVPEGYTGFQTKFEGVIWESEHAPLQKTTYRYRDGKKELYKKVEYMYAKLK